MASERAKALAAKQKAERKEAKRRKKDSDDPKDWNRLKQLVEVFKRTKEFDPKLVWLMAGAGVAAFVVVLVVGIVLGSWLIYGALGILLGVVAALWVLLLRARSANYRRYHGEKGSAEVALAELNQKKWTTSMAITMDKSMNMVHRAVGPAGIVLVAEGEQTRAKQLLASETRRHEQVAYGIPVTAFMLSDKPGDVPLEALAKQIKKLKKSVSSTMLTEVKQRLKALDAIRPKVPIPRGPLPNMRGAHRAMRGR